MFNIKVTLVTTKGAKERVHHKGLPMGIIEFHCHHHHALKNFTFFPNLKSLAHFGGLMY